MTSFRFRLEKVLAWRRTQLEMEEARFQRCTHAIADLDRRRAQLEADGIRAEVQVRGWEPLVGSDLEGLAAFRRYVSREEKQIALRREEAGRHLDAQRQALLEAQRRCRLLERFRARRLAEWQAAADREMDQLAAESHLAAFARGQRQ